jgi:tRNA(fMet)-specific endonuclease VapC
MYLLDTNTLIYFFKQEGQVGQRLKNIPVQLIKLPSLAIFELEYGTAKSVRPEPQRHQIDEVLKVFELMPLDYKSAKSAGVIRHQLSTLGKPIGLIDQLIAGIAIANDLVVVTRNVSEFSRVPNLRVENWF